jgi:hypothetical protein
MRLGHATRRQHFLHLQGIDINYRFKQTRQKTGEEQEGYA